MQPLEPWPWVAVIASFTVTPAGLVGPASATQFRDWCQKRSQTRPLAEIELNQKLEQIKRVDELEASSVRGTLSEYDIGNLSHWRIRLQWALLMGVAGAAGAEGITKVLTILILWQW